MWLGALRVAAGDPPGGQAALEESLLHAARAKDDLTVARAWSLLVYTLGVEMDRGDDALALLPAANAAAARAGDAAMLHAGLLARAAAVQCRNGHAADARKSLEGALRLDQNAVRELGEKGQALISADCRPAPGRSP